MVRKLFKHELEYYIRSLVPMYIILGIVAAMGRFVQFFEAETTAYEILQGSSVFMLVVACIAAVFLSLLFAIVRFYKNMFSGEGYLTMTLPVTPTQHLWVKLATALIANVATFIAVALAVCIFTAGPWLVEICKAIAYLYNQVAKQLNGNLGWYFVEMIPAFLVSMAASLLLYYACMSVGQLAKKNRILAAIGAYFGLYVINQILSTVMMVVVTTSGMIDEFAEWFFQLTERQMQGWVHGFIWIGIAWMAVIGLVFFLVSRYILSKKLNLE